MAERVELGALRCAAAEIGVELSVIQGESIVGYARMLERWNEKFNMVSRRDVVRLLSRHVLDSLSIHKWLRGERILDLGSGAGLPGIPLAIVNGHRQFLLVDRNARKARFLEQVAMAFKLDNVAVQCRNADELGAEPPFTTIVSRAVAGLPKLWRIATPLLEDGGRLLFMNRTGLLPGLPAGVHADATGVANAAPPGLPAGLNVVRERLTIPGLSGSHEVLIVDKPR